MGRLPRLNRTPIVIIFNECTINDTGDLSVRQDVDITDTEGGSSPTMLIAGMADVFRKVLVGTLGMLGAASKEDMKEIQRRIEVIEGKA
jgi:hypothetical protein